MGLHRRPLQVGGLLGVSVVTSFRSLDLPVAPLSLSSGL
jgi:hypothetical protein